MKKVSQISQEDFQNLLNWLSDDREKAGEIYEEIRRGLIRFFRFRGCEEPESLTDETFNRVAGKISLVEFDENLKINAYFYSFAANILLEYIARRKKASFVELKENLADENTLQTKETERELSCLDVCLARLQTEERNLILQYYSRDKKEKIELRTKLAEELYLKAGALHTRGHRLRLVLRECVEKCLAEKGM